MSNPSLAELVLFRAQVGSAIRAFFALRGVVELTTPSLVSCPGMEPHLRAFAISPVEAVEVRDRWLHTSPELAVKTVLHGLDFDVFVLSRCYRDEPPTSLHHPEFTMLEWYRRHSDYTLVMSDCEALVRAVVTALVPNARSDVDGAGGALDIWSPFERVTCDEAFLRAAGVSALAPADALRRAAREAGVDVGDDWDREALFSVVYAECVEPGLGWPRPTFVTEFPASESALARLKPGDERVAERFELYLGARGPDGVRSLEIANAFSELVDADEQQDRFESDRRCRRAANAPVYELPEAMLEGLDALDETAGIALGVERLLVWAALVTRGWQTTVADWFAAEPLARPETGVR